MTVVLGVAVGLAALTAGTAVGCALLPYPSRTARMVAAAGACLVLGLVVVAEVLAQ